MVGTCDPDDGARPKNELRLIGDVRPGLRGPEFGEGPRYMFVTTLAAGHSELARRCPLGALVDLARAIGTLGAVVGSSCRAGRVATCTLISDGVSVCDSGRGRGLADPPMTLFALCKRLGCSFSPPGGGGRSLSVFAALRLRAASEPPMRSGVLSRIASN